MTARVRVLELFFLICIAARASAEINPSEKNLINFLEENLELKFSDYANSFTKWLASFNDRHIGKSEFGKMLHYDQIKPKIEDYGRHRSVKKMSMAMLPLVFHIGATSTWMVLTSIMAVKSVALGLILLVFKIAVSSAKVSSFFTSLKNKDHHHYDWSSHHGHDRSLSFIEHHSHLDDGASYNPDWLPSTYKTIPANYKSSDHDLPAEPHDFQYEEDNSSLDYKKKL